MGSEPSMARPLPMALFATSTCDNTSASVALSTAAAAAAAGVTSSSSGRPSFPRLAGELLKAVYS